LHQSLVRVLNKIITMKNKTVYILGAGFAVEAGAPIQEKLISEIFKVNEKAPHVFRDDSIAQFKNFLTNTLNIGERWHNTIPLEDIFTPLDSCIANNLSFRNLSVEKLKDKRQLVFELIGLTMQHILMTTPKDYITQFADYLVFKSKQRISGNYKNCDPVSVLSTNWDILLDNSINLSIQDDDFNNTEQGVVDYCCHVSSYEKNDETVKPGLEILGRGGYNVKLLKLHGSLNWLLCPRCQRIYVKFYQKIAMNPFNGISNHSCRHCDKNFGKESSHRLVSNLIMPTYLKDLTNPQYKIIWQNAGIELSEAKKIVFIGYSLPQADFEMRQLLARMVDKKTEIEVVDIRGDKNPDNYDSLVRNYEQFFGRKILSYEFGASKYIEEKIKPLIEAVSFN